MLIRRLLPVVAGLLAAGSLTATCPTDPAVQVLGSGGPIADDARAGSGYLVWHRGRARVLVDAGGGVFVRFGEAGARLAGLDLIAITHLHTDHVGDLPALLKGSYFSDRTRPLPLAGPSGNARFPGIKAHVRAQFDADRGAFAYLSGLLDGSGKFFRLALKTVDAGSRRPIAVPAAAGLTVHAIGLHHGPVPSLAWRIELAGRRIVISGDQNLTTDGFAEFARRADVLVMPMAIPESAGPAAAGLHAKPSAIGRAAAEAGAGRLVLSHFMARSLRHLEKQLEHIRAGYDGPITVAEDLQCIALD